MSKLFLLNQHRTFLFFHIPGFVAQYKLLYTPTDLWFQVFGLNSHKRSKLKPIPQHHQILLDWVDPTTELIVTDENRPMNSSFCLLMHSQLMQVIQVRKKYLRLFV